MSLIGTLGLGALAEVDAAGTITGATVGSLRWWIAAEDRWHTPPTEQTLRQTRLDGAPVIETMFRVPGGDVVHRAFAIYDGPAGSVVIEIENRSTQSVAVAFDRSDLRTARPPANVPIQGIDLPAGSITMPIAKQSSLVVVLGQGAGALPDRLPTSAEVANGWLRVLDTAPRLQLPDAQIRLGALADRAETILRPLPDAASDPVAFLFAAAEFQRAGIFGRSAPDDLIDDVAVAAGSIARSHRKSPTSASRPALLRAAEILGGSGQALAVADIERLLGALVPALGSQPPCLSDTFATRDADGIVLLDQVIPRDWYGQPLEVHDAPIGNARISYAIRWHAERPALLWDSTLDAPLRCPGLDPTWRSSGAKGEALLAAPPEG